MAAGWLTPERLVRLALLLLVIGLPIGVVLARGKAGKDVVLVRAAMPEAGGWMPGDLTARVDEPLNLRLTSVDVVHGFALGQSDLAPVDLKPGEIVDLTLEFDQPGTYTYYCTRWCGPNHWRMRGTIEVAGPEEETTEISQPLYLQLGLDLDAPHPIEGDTPSRPSAVRGAALEVDLPPAYLSREYYRSYSPAQIWTDLSQEASAANLSAGEVWDLVAFLWWNNTSDEALTTGQALYAENCSACHGEAGRGDGVMAAGLQSVEDFGGEMGNFGHEYGHKTISPTDFTAGESMLGASPALLQGKILRGGMGTGMPYWGPIFSEEQTWALVDYLWTYQFDEYYSDTKR